MQEKTKTEPKRNANNFEEAIEKLEKIVGDMEQGNLPLEKLINNFSEGTKLINFCQNKINSAELKIKEIQDSLVTADDFDADSKI